jgi:transposase-like protein
MDRQRTMDGRRRWRQWTERDARAALAELARSGEGIGRFARRKGVSEQRLYYWRKRIAETGAPSFVAVPVTAARRAELEIVGDGITLRVREDLDIGRVADLIEVVARRGRGC